MSMNSSTKNITNDTLFDGTLSCCQHKEGYRFSLDAVLVSQFLKPAKEARILDLGCGCGVISLILAYRYGTLGVQISSLEYQPALATLAQENIENNRFTDICEVVQGDVRNILKYFAPESFDQIVCNPPFFKLGHGRTNKNIEAFEARHQVNGTLDDFLYGASRVLKNRGNCVFIYPAPDSVDFFTAARARRLEPKRIQYIYNHPEAKSDARLCLIQCQKNGGAGVRVEPPFYVYNSENGEYHQGMDLLYDSKGE